jgi:hypothetical protein
METARKLVGKPFQKGDARINRGGRPKQLLTKALAETLTDADAKAITLKVIALAKAGDLQAAQMVWDRLEGKAIARAENGQPGDFELDLSDVDTKTLRAAFKRVK